MLKRWQAYVIRHILTAIAMVLLLLMGLQIFILFANELSSIGQGNYDLWQAFIYILLSLPRQLYLFFPITCLLGSLLGLGVLANHNELTVLRAAGISIAQIALVVVKAALVLIIVVTLVGEFVVPKTNHIAAVRRAIARSGNQAINTKTGIWLREGQDFIHIDQTIGNHELQGITRYHFDAKQELVSASIAERAQFDEQQWHVEKIKTTLFFSDHTQVKLTPTAIWPLRLNPTLLAISALLPSDMSMRELSAYINEQNDNGTTANYYQLEFWQRLLQPVVTCLMMLLALPFIFGQLRSVPMGTRFLIGALVGFSFYMLNRIVAPMSIVVHLSPLIAAALPVVICATLVILLLRRS